MKKAVVLLSGGLDSAVALFWAKREGYDCHCLTFDYGQRHRRELECAGIIALSALASQRIMKLDFAWKGSSLLDNGMALPTGRTADEIKAGAIPSTYVPARNTVFMSLAASYAESIGAEAICIGAHSEDSSGYPDCRIEYLQAFERILWLGTKAGGEGKLKLEFPLIKKTKSDIIQLGFELGVPFASTMSCYAGGDVPCGVCDSCVLRAKGFKEAGFDDPSVPKSVPDIVPVQKEENTRITEIFSSMQGEGVFVGARQIFVRFADCNMSCAYCDERTKDVARDYTVRALLDEVARIEHDKGPHHSVSLTGGEPLMNDAFLRAFLPSLRKSGARIYLETNGTVPEKLAKVIDQIDIVAMDLKLPSATKDRAYWDEHREFLEIASRVKVFIKTVVTPETHPSDIEIAMDIVRSVDRDIPFVIQPASSSMQGETYIRTETLISFVDIATRKDINNVRVIPQMHKTMGIR